MPHRREVPRGLLVEYGGSIVHPSSRKQEICTKDLTEAELVAMSDYVPRMERTKEYLIGQGERICNTILFQDNTSCIQILKDPNIGKLRTRFIRARSWSRK